MESLFPIEPTDEPASDSQPLAFRLSPKSLDEYVGQTHLLGPGKPIRVMIESDALFSCLFWGPPGCGKTALSRIISTVTQSHYIALNAVTASIADIKKSVKEAKEIQQAYRKKTILFIDEIHRFNKTQQDALLPEVESGLLTLIGATTENPFFSVIPALLSRTQIFQLEPHTETELTQLLDRAEDRLENSPSLEADTRKALIHASGGDARKCLGLYELVISTHPQSQTITLGQLEELLQAKGIPGNDDDHYDCVSAFIKSMRGSDPDASVYWLARLLQQGEPPEFIARRMIVFASEDIGNADPQALVLATSVLDAVKFIGMPECQINLSHVTIYLATAPKSNATYMAINAANKHIQSGKRYEVPQHLKDSHYKGAKALGHGKGYLYPHDYPHGLVQQTYLPESVSFYHPKEIGFEREIVKRIVFKKNISPQ